MKELNHDYCMESSLELTLLEDLISDGRRSPIL